MAFSLPFLYLWIWRFSYSTGHSYQYWTKNVDTMGGIIMLYLFLKIMCPSTRNLRNNCAHEREWRQHIYHYAYPFVFLIPSHIRIVSFMLPWTFKGKEVRCSVTKQKNMTNHKLENSANFISCFRREKYWNDGMRRQ